MKTALFVNYSDELFTGAWDGKTKSFKSGESVYMPDYLAKHFAKHLANRELLKLGKEKDTSPKLKMKPDGTEYYDNDSFNEMFFKGYRPETDEEFGSEKDDIDVQISVANKNRQERDRQKNAPTVAQEQPKKVEQKADEPQVVLPPDFEDDEDDSGSIPVELAS